MPLETSKLFDYHSQCLTCNLSDKISTAIHDWFEAKAGPTEISRHLLETHKIKISPDALSNHLKFHSLQDAEPDEVVTPSQIKPPKGWEPQATIKGDEGEIVSPAQNKPDLTEFSDILRFFKIDPDVFEVLDETIQVRQWQAYGGDWQSYYKFNIRKKRPNSFNLPTLFAETKANIVFKKPEPRQKNPNRTLVVPFADLQAGKVGSRGDSKALIERTAEKRYMLEEYALAQSCAKAVFLDGGDIVESFENTAQQGFTNDLSIMEQLDLAGTIEQEFITMLARIHDEVEVGGVPSNHAAWRKGKDILGRPSDDWGLFLLKQIEKAYALNPEVYGNISFTYPEEWRKSLSIEVQGVGVGLVHGEDSSFAQMENWWAKQVHGASPVAQSDILITNHYHTMGFKASGRSLRTGKQKYWLATPTLDNGSDWWANKSGSDSDPGLMAFVVDSEIGLDKSSWTIL